jgi:hypothetical protein
MRGHKPIIAMRKRGVAPKIVFLNDFPCQTSEEWQNPGEKHGEIWPADHATVSTSGDQISSLDLRFLVGLKVSITSDSEGRAKALFAKAKSSGAMSVAACHIEPTDPYRQGGWFEIFHANEVTHA